ncbi:MAG: hypothetical protein ACJA1C_003264 [Crocinitomicaceae bacterium]|jgi:hypothetical protein
MTPNITKIIDQYLSGELNAEDKAVFEERLASNKELQEEVRLQESINEGAKRASQRAQVRKAGKKYHYQKLLKWSGMSALALALATAATLYLVNPVTSDTDSKTDTPEISEQLKEALFEYAQIDNLPIEYFPIAQDGGVVLSNKGVMLSVPKEAFLLNGKPYNGPVVIQYQEAISGSDIVKSGLSTMAGDRMLETQGMFGVGGFTPDGQQLEFNPKVGVYIQTPVDEYKEKMQLFDGVKLANGTIDWQNPVPLEKIPVPVDMSELNFYPAGYEAFLDSKKWKQNKWSRDSLYLSLENFDYENSLEPIYSATQQTPKTIDPPHIKITPTERDYLYGDNRPIDSQMTAEEAIRLSQWKEGPRYDEYFKKMNPNADPEKVSVNLKSNPNSRSQTRVTYVKEPESIAAYSIVLGYAASAVAVAAPSRDYLAPSKVLAFWKKEFNNTNLATREFEKRVQAIHQKCGKANMIIDKYTSQLQKPMWQIDKEVAAMGYPEFEEFATENIGVMDANNPHIKGLKAFYEKGIDKLKKQNKTYQDLEKKRQGDWDKDMSKERSNEQTRKTKRTAESLDQEYKFNMNNVKKHLGGKSRGFTIKHGKGPVMKNIDAYVREATIARQTTTVIDPITGNKTKIKYNSFNFEVPNADKYLKLYTYVFPNKIKAFQRITGTNGKFDYNLNDGMIYDIAVVGITKDGYEYFQKSSIKKGSLGMVDMKRVSEAKLDASVKQLNSKRTSRPMKIDNEMDWLVKEQKDYKEQKMRTDMFDFRSQLRSVAFPCFGPVEVADNDDIAIGIPGQ